MNRSLLPETSVNGGFPEPPPDEPVRVVVARHAACGEATRVCLPGSVPARAVRRLCCSSCAVSFDAEGVEELGLEREPETAPRTPRFAAKGSATLPGATALPAAHPAAAAALARPGGAPALAVRPAAVAVSAPAQPASQPQAPSASRRRLSLPKLDTANVRLPKFKLPEAARREISLPKLSAMRRGGQPQPAGAGGGRLAGGGGFSLPKLPDAARREISIPKFDPQSRAWQLASIVIAAIAVIAVLLAVQGGDSAPSATAPPEATGESAAAVPGAPGAAGGEGKAKDGPAKETTFVSGSTYSLVLPKGWEEVEASGGATFAAVAPGGAADATLWIEEDPKLGYPEFVANSLAQLEALAGSAEIVERQPAPTPEDTVVRLAADSPAGQPTYEVVLRASGPYRYHLAITTQPEAPADVIEGAEQIAGSLTPEAKG